MHTNQINYKIIAKPFLIHKKHFGQTDKVLLNALYTCLAEPEQKVVLDLGCGNGKIANEVVEKIASIQKVFALDIEKDLIEDAQENNAHSKIVYSVVNPGKVDTKILADNSVDIAYSVYVLMEPKEETTVLAIIQNAYDKLTPGGTYCALNSNI
jgi:ubiquinone/menaquinone biosynthesis C-methylase UbiE